MARHTFSIMAINNGMPITTIKTILGHADIETTKHYIEVVDTTVSADMKRLEIYIDDAALGAPLKGDASGAPPFIDWGIASLHLYAYGLLTDADIIALVEDGVVNPEHVRIDQ